MLQLPSTYTSKGLFTLYHINELNSQLVSFDIMTAVCTKLASTAIQPRLSHNSSEVSYTPITNSRLTQDLITNQHCSSRAINGAAARTKTSSISSGLGYFRDVSMKSTLMRTCLESFVIENSNRKSKFGSLPTSSRSLYCKSAKAMAVAPKLEEQTTLLAGTDSQMDG